MTEPKPLALGPLGWRMLACVICDDIRREDTGKGLLLGCYDSGLIMAELPSPLFLCVRLEFLHSKPAGAPFVLQLCAPGDLIVAHAMASLGKGTGSFASANLRLSGAQASMPGTFGLKFGFLGPDGGPPEVELIREFSVGVQAPRGATH